MKLIDIGDMQAPFRAPMFEEPVNITITLSRATYDKLDAIARYRRTDPEQIASNILTSRLRVIRVPTR